MRRRSTIYCLVFDLMNKHHFVETIEDFRSREASGFSIIENGPFSRLQKRAQKLNIQTGKLRAKLPEYWQ